MARNQVVPQWTSIMLVYEHGVNPRTFERRTTFARQTASGHWPSLEHIRRE